jgi:hypothetical protein
MSEPTPIEPPPEPPSEPLPPIPVTDGCGFIMLTFAGTLLSWLGCGILLACISDLFPNVRSGLSITLVALFLGGAGAYLYFKNRARGFGLGMVIAAGFLLVLASLCGR